MTSITLSVPEDIRKKMKEFPEINWSGLVRKAIEERISRLVWKEEMLKKFKEEKEFTDWTVEMGRKLKSERLKELKRRIV